MDPITLRQQLDNARYQLEQAAQRRSSFEIEAQGYEDQAADLIYQAQKYQKYAEDARAQAISYAASEDTARRDLEYYANQLMQAEQYATQY